MPGTGPGIHVFWSYIKDVDGPGNPGHGPVGGCAWPQLHHPPGSHRRGVSRLSSYAASNTGAASVDSICKTVSPVLEKPCLRPAGTMTSCPLVKVTCASSIHTSACPS